MAIPRDERRLSYSDGLEVVQPPLEPTAFHNDPGMEVYHGPTDPWKKPHQTFSPLYARPSSTDAPEAVQNHQDHVYGELPPPLPTICGIRRRVFWILAAVIAFVVVAGAIGGGVGGYFASKASSTTSGDSSGSSTPGSNNNNTTTPPARSAFQNISIAALSWVDESSARQIRVYQTTQWNSTHPPRILESSWDSAGAQWSVEPITDPAVDGLKPGTPLTAAAGYPHTNTSNALVKNVYFYQPTGKLAERQSPYKELAGVWGYDNFSGLYTASNLSAVFSYWYQNFDTRLQVLTNFFQELGANSLTAARYFENVTDGQPWESIRHSFPIQDGSSIAAAPAGSRRDLRLYIGGTDGTMKQYPYNIETNEMGTVTDTAFELPPGTPICVTTEDNRNYFSDTTLPECARTNRGAFITHLILFASPDGRDLNLVSWNCSSGFLTQKNRINDLLKPGRTYLGLSATPQTNLTYFDQRVYVLYAEDGSSAASSSSGGQQQQRKLKMEEWQVPTSGGPSGLVAPGQNGPFRLMGEVPTIPTV
ncbi:hypothetical protein B0H66DRAFT_525501 [Apodospora peruviana]|uniref:Fucose-specific lectin n=1 Tax=Apodospora peruviana TaxID=516989 RepID=A0AAE0HT53_9PEZI|nr:hypothetical protein B0H66DRAFT_525501 [Apodospora peruviana]